jgi:hypothetical protein
MNARGTAWWTEHDRPFPARERPETVRRRPEPLTDLADPARLRAYRQALIDKALGLPRASHRRRDVEKQLASVTGQLLRLELKGRR